MNFSGCINCYYSNTDRRNDLVEKEREVIFENAEIETTKDASEWLVDYTRHPDCPTVDRQN